jgi:hypothetical protein
MERILYLKVKVVAEDPYDVGSDRIVQELDYNFGCNEKGVKIINTEILDYD